MHNCKTDTMHRKHWKTSETEVLSHKFGDKNAACFFQGKNNANTDNVRVYSRTCNLVPVNLVVNGR